MKITSELILSWGPCEGYDEDRIRDLVGDGMTPLEIMDLEISLRDRVWIIAKYLRHTGRHDELSHLACDLVEAVLPIYEEEYPGDDRPRRAIEAKRAHLAGAISDEELDAAAHDAFAAAVADAPVAAAYAAAVADVPNRITSLRTYGDRISDFESGINLAQFLPGRGLIIRSKLINIVKRRIEND